MRRKASGRSEAEINDGIRKKACGRKAFAGGPVAGQRRMRSDSFLACGGFPANAFLRMPSCRRLSLTPIGFWLAEGLPATAFLHMLSCRRLSLIQLCSGLRRLSCECLPAHALMPQAVFDPILLWLAEGFPADAFLRVPTAGGRPSLCSAETVISSRLSFNVCQGVAHVITNVRKASCLARSSSSDDENLPYYAQRSFLERFRISGPNTSRRGFRDVQHC
jgi:hypothetical protein